VELRTDLLVGVSLVKLQRTIHAKLVLDREGKREAVEREYWAWQRQLRGNNEQLYSATKQQAERFKQRVKKTSMKIFIPSEPPWPQDTRVPDNSPTRLRKSAVPERFSFQMVDANPSQPEEHLGSNPTTIRAGTVAQV